MTFISLSLAPRIKVSARAYVLPASYCLLLVGNDIFNADKVRLVSIVADQSYHVA